MHNEADQTFFQRYENKYVLTPEQYARLMEHLPGHAVSDGYGCYDIVTVYHDTADYALIRQALEKPTYRIKLRLRSYGVPEGPGSLVFLEMKKKLAGVTHKRRLPLALGDAEAYLAGAARPAGEAQLLAEFDHLLAGHRPEAKVALSCRRTAYTGLADENLRITIDEGVHWRQSELTLLAGTGGTPLFADDTRLMEIKTLTHLPYGISRLLSQLGIYPTPFSKYGTVYRNYIAQQMGAVVSGHLEDESSPNGEEQYA